MRLVTDPGQENWYCHHLWFAKYRGIGQSNDIYYDVLSGVNCARVETEPSRRRIGVVGLMSV